MEIISRLRIPAGQFVFPNCFQSARLQPVRPTLGWIGDSASEPQAKDIGLLNRPQETNAPFGARNTNTSIAAGRHFPALRNPRRYVLGAEIHLRRSFGRRECLKRGYFEDRPAVMICRVLAIEFSFGTKLMVSWPKSRPSLRRPG